MSDRLKSLDVVALTEDLPEHGLLASAPAWRHLDPLPVLGREEEEEKDQQAPQEEDQDLKDEEHRAKWVLEGR